MSTLTDYYIHEMDSWKERMLFYQEETEGIEAALKRALLYNTVPRLAERVEHYLSQFYLARQNFAWQFDKIHALETKLHSSDPSAFSIEPSLAEEIKELRKGMRHVERDYLDKYYDCAAFLAEVVALQSGKRNDIV